MLEFDKIIGDGIEIRLLRLHSRGGGIECSKHDFPLTNAFYTGCISDLCQLGAGNLVEFGVKQRHGALTAFPPAVALRSASPPN